MCCGYTAVWHRCHSRTFKLGQSVTVSNETESFGLGIVTGNPGENACGGDVRNRFLIEVTYIDGSKYHCVPCQVWPADLPKQSEAGRVRSGGFSVTAVTLGGEEVVVPGLSSDTLVVELRQRLAEIIRERCWWLVQLSLDDMLLKDGQSLGGLFFLADEPYKLNFVVRARDKWAWQWSMACLLHALRLGEDGEVRKIVEETVAANRKFHLTHVVKKVCLAGQEETIQALLEHIPMESFCQALLINRSSISDRYRKREKPILYHLWEFHNAVFVSLCVKLLEKGCLGKLCELISDERGERIFGSTWSHSAIGGWMHVLRETDPQALKATLEDPKRRPDRCKHLTDEFVRDVEQSGFTLRDFHAMQTHETCSGLVLRPERMDYEDCTALPAGLKPLLLKWTRDFRGKYHRRKRDWSTVEPEEDFILAGEFGERFVIGALGSFIHIDALLMLAKEVPDGLDLLHGDYADEVLDRAELLADRAEEASEHRPRQRHAQQAQPRAGPARELHSVAKHLQRRELGQAESRRNMAHKQAEKERSRQKVDQARARARDEKQWGRSGTSEKMPDDADS